MGVCISLRDLAAYLHSMTLPSGTAQLTKKTVLNLMETIDAVSATVNVVTVTERRQQPHPMLKHTQKKSSTSIKNTKCILTQLKLRLIQCVDPARLLQDQFASFVM